MYPLAQQVLHYFCDVSTGRPRPIVPNAWRRHIFETIHGLSHPGIQATQKLLCTKFVWHGLRRQVVHWVRTCIPCQTAKVQRHTKAPLATFYVPHRRFDHMHIDIVGPLPPSREGHTHLLTMVDRFTRWPEAIPLTDTSTITCARAFILHWIARFGLPAHLSSDRGPQFTSQLWTDIACLLGTTLHHTTAYHPQANGLVERFHRHLKSALKARLTGVNWLDDLPWVLLGIGTAPKEDLDTSSAELVFGAPLTVPGNFLAKPSDTQDPTDFLSALRSRVRALAPIPTSHHGTFRPLVPADLFGSQFVFVRRDAHRSPFQRPYDGPFKVLEHGPKAFTLDVDGSPKLVSVDRLKPVHLDIDQPVSIAQPRRRAAPSVPVTTSTSAVPYRPTTSTRSGRTVRRPVRYQ